MTQIYGGFQTPAFQNDYQTSLVNNLVSDPDYVVIRPYSYRFCSKTPEDQVVLTFNFQIILETGESMFGFTPNVWITNLYGGDPNPQQLLNGAPQIDTTGTLILVPVMGGFDMNDYIVNASCQTNNPSKFLEWPGILPVRIFPNRIGAP